MCSLRVFGKENQECLILCFYSFMWQVIEGFPLLNLCFYKDYETLFYTLCSLISFSVTKFCAVSEILTNIDSVDEFYVSYYNSHPNYV